MQLWSPEQLTSDKQPLAHVEKPSSSQYWPAMHCFGPSGKWPQGVMPERVVCSPPPEEPLEQALKKATQATRLSLEIIAELPRKTRLDKVTRGFAPRACYPPAGRSIGKSEFFACGLATRPRGAIDASEALLLRRKFGELDSGRGAAAQTEMAFS
jgi:hypothetical protein